MSALKKSNVYVDVVFITKNSRLLNSYIHLTREPVEAFGKTKTLLYKVFLDKTLKVNDSVTEQILQRASETTYVEEHSQSFMKKNCEGAVCAEPVQWV